MQKLTRKDLLSLEEYAERRSEFRTQILTHKKDRQLAIGPNATLYFEDRLAVQYQIQEMLRVERIFEKAGIEDELEAYNPLIPDGGNWKATFMLEYEDEDERKIALAKLIGIEDRTWMQVKGFDRVWAIADEDLDRENEEKTSSVHFLRFELDPSMRTAVRAGSDINAGIDHTEYRYECCPVPQQIRNSIAQDILDDG